MAKIVINPTSASKQEVPIASRVISIGRDPLNDLVLSDSMVSRRHAILEQRDGDYILRDNNSSTGTMVNGDRLKSEQALCDGDLVAIGSSRLLFQIGEAEETPVSRPASSAEAESQAAKEPTTPASGVDPAAPSTVTPSGATSSKSSSSKPLQALAGLVHDLVIAVVVCVVLIAYVVQAFKIQGTSMSPELADGERILVNKFLYYFGEIERGDVVVFWCPEDPELSFIKRVVALPGESVEIKKGNVYVEGRLVNEPYVIPRNADQRSHAPLQVRPGHYFVLGDNRRGSNDSRSWGLVPARYIYGKAFVRIWPISKVGAVR